jgi:hypothetical protein
MSTYWGTLRDMDLDELAEYGSRIGDSPSHVNAVNVAFPRLQTKAMQEAAAAQVDAALAVAGAAKAAEDTARHTKNTAWWMMWSVIVIAISSILNLVVTLLRRH